jgi:protoporphyrinogen IX oxidase
VIAATFYPWIKAAHLVAIMLFVGGALAVAILCQVLPRLGDQAMVAAQAVRRWDQRVTSPALLATWGMGLWLASSGHWFTQTWLQLKLVLVLLLSGLHGMQSGRLRRLAAGGDAAPSSMTPVLLICIAAIAGLAVLKPA